MKLGIYIHIPFCKKKCMYCDFVSYEQKENMQERYIKALKKEIESWIIQNPEVEIETIYIGGGTPSYIDSKNIVDIIKLLSKNEILANLYKENEKPQITIEINPGTVTKQKLQDFRQIGIDRLSIGLQSTKNKLLKQIGRIHTYQDFLETYKMARNMDFNNINVDLMIGLPNQSIKDIKESLEEILKLEPYPPEHISIYSLIVEDNTPMQKLIDNGKIELPNEEEERNMYWYVKNLLELNGYNHYEISNFSKPGYESKHNMDCWEQKEYRGFGVAAHSYINKKRFCNISNMEKYIQNIENADMNSENITDIKFKNIIIEEEQTKFDQMQEFMLLGLRKINGVSINSFKNKFNENPIMLFKNKLNKLYEEKLIIIDGDIIRLSNRGINLANLVWEEFV